MGANTYPIEEWVITEEKFLKEWNYRNETTFALSNGYIGTRGTFDEGYPFTVDEGLEGNFINGFYESEHIMYGEWNFGFPEKSQRPSCGCIYGKSYQQQQSGGKTPLY